VHARRGRWWAAVPALVALVLYAPSLSLGFVRDDHGLIEGHVALREGPAQVARALLSDFHAGTGGGSGKWRPWVTLSYAVDGALGGWRPPWFHASNVIAHALASACVGLLVVQSGVAVPIALLAGTAFAVMPAHVEPVAWIAARTDLLAGLFMCAALWLDGRRRRARRGGPGWIAPGLFALALLSKETSLAFLAVIAAAVGSAACGARPQRPWHWLAPYAVVAAVWAAGWLAIGGVPARPEYVDAERAKALEGGAAWTAAALLRFTLPGVTHAPDWPLPAARSAADSRVAAGLALWAALGLAVMVAVRRRSAFATPLALVAAPLVPIAVGASGGFAGGAVMAERLVYAASAGVVWTAALAAAWAFDRPGPRRRTAAWVAGAAACVLLAHEARVTWRDQSMYRDDAHVYAAMWARVPQHATGAVGLATVRMVEGRLDEALALLERAEALDPRIPEIHQARAEIAFSRARWAEAAAAAERVIGLDPTRGYPRLLRAAARVRMGEGDAVAAEIDSLGELLPDDPMLLAARGERRLAAGRHAEAVTDLERALRAQPGDPFIGLALARALRATGAADRALAVLGYVVRIAPGSAEAWQAYADAAGAVGRAAQRDSALARVRLLRGVETARP
jgi:tetratricopeptide (TPR) repeat protein